MTALTPAEKSRLIDLLIAKTTEMVIAKTMALTEEEALASGAFEETAFSDRERDKLFEDFLHDCFHPVKEEQEYE